MLQQRLWHASRRAQNPRAAWHRRCTPSIVKEARMRVTKLLMTVVLASCAGGGQAVRPDEMSAGEHKQEAEHEREAAHLSEAGFSANASRPSPFRDPTEHAAGDYLYSIPIYNPTEGRLADAERHRAHARQHEAAARSLEEFEQVECKDFPPATRAACPLLGPATAIDDIPGGVRVTFAPGTRVDAVVAHMRCHYAYARARAFAEAVSCPLYIRGIEIRQGPNPMAVEITAREARATDEIRMRSREEAVFLRKELNASPPPPASP
jgi:hypothetical protein